MRRYISITLVFALAVSALSGCASKYGEQKTVVNYYPSCYRPIHDLRQREGDVAKGTAGGAVVGALGGALLGLIVSGGKWQGAAVGAATGGVAGTMAGAMYARKQRDADDNRRLASYLQDLDGDISNLDVAGAAARVSLQCYDRQFNVLLADIKARKITREVAERRFGEITSGREEAIAILGNAVTQGRNLNQQYEEAFASEERQLQSPDKLAKGQTAHKRNVSNLNAARQRKQVLTQKTADLEREKNDAQSVTSRQTQELNAAYADLADIRA